MKITRKGRWIARMCSLFLAAVFVFGSAGSVFGMAAEQEDSGSYYYEEKEHSDVDYADMEYRGVDPHALDDLLAELGEITDGVREVEDPETRTVEIYYEILSGLDKEYTQYVLGDVLHYRDVTDAKQAERNTLELREIQDMSDAIYISLQKAMQGPYSGELRKQFTDRQLNDLTEYQALTDEERDLLEKDKNLMQTYDRLAEENYVFEYKGENWDLNRLYQETPEDYDEVVDIYMGICRKMNEATVPIFQDMIRTRRSIAEMEGYKNYTDYCYDLTYGRDFTGEDIAALRETVIEELRPLYDELRTMQQFNEFTFPETGSMTGEELMGMLAKHIGDVHPELREACDYLQKHKMYYIGNQEAMADAGFTTNLPEYGSAVIYYKTGGTLQDLETIVHEFGHFNAAFHTSQNTLMDSLLVDVAEIQSQGLEMLFVDEMKEICSDDPEGLELFLLVNMLDSVLTGFEYDEFQQEVYSREDMTVEELNRLAMDIDNKYTQYFFDEDGQSYEWVQINHTFDSPLYYIGYATSALSALDIWTQSLQDRGAAVDKYMQLSAVPTDMPYEEAVTSCGLRNMLEKENIRALANEIRAWAGLEKEGAIGDYTRPEEETAPKPKEETAPKPKEETAPKPEEEITPAPEEERPGEMLPEESYEYNIEEYCRRVLRSLGIITWIPIGVRVLILIIALAAFSRRKKRGGRGPGGGYGPNDGYGPYSGYDPNDRYGPHNGYGPNNGYGPYDGYDPYNRYGCGPDPDAEDDLNPPDGWR